MSQTVNLALRQAEDEVQKSNQEFEDALNQLKQKVEGGVQTVEKYATAAKNPKVMLGMIVVIGVFLGQLVRLSFTRK